MRVSQLICGSLVLLVGSTPAAHAFLGLGHDDEGAAHPKRNFLPPVATINPPLEADVPEEDLGPVTLSAVTSPVLKTRPQPTKIDSDLGIRAQDETYKQLLDMQRSQNEEDLKILWDATVERNPVIRFSLEKLASPPELQTKQSSLFMRKSLNVLISGATMAATMLPGAGGATGYYRNMGSMAAGDALRNLVNGKQTLPANMLSATEKIQLAGMIDELQSTIVQNYHDYKNTLQSLVSAHQSTVENNGLYSEALHSGNRMAILAAGTAYYQSLMDETELRQKAKLYRLKLERLAGAESVAQLKLSVAYSQDLLQESGLTAENRTSTEPSESQETAQQAPEPQDILTPAGQITDEARPLPMIPPEMNDVIQ